MTDFQVAEAADGSVAGAVGFAVSQRHALVHSEGFQDFSVADDVRPFFWTRIQGLCLNHGIACVWSQEHSPFWSRNGLVPAGEEELKKLPPAWANESPGWLTLKIGRASWRERV